MWILQSGKIIAQPMPLLLNGVNHSKNIFLKWSIEELATLGISPFREEGFDNRRFRSTGATDTMQDGTMVRTHTLVDRYSVDDARPVMIDKLKSSYIALMNKAVSNESFYNAIGDSENKKVWSDYVIALKNDAKELRDMIDAVDTCGAILNLQFNFTPSPDTHNHNGPE